MVMHLGKRFSSDVADGKCALSEGSATKCGHFPHHVTRGTCGAQQFLVSESQGRRGEARRMSETQAGVRGRQIPVCVPCSVHEP